MMEQRLICPTMGSTDSVDRAEELAALLGAVATWMTSPTSPFTSSTAPSV